MFSFGFFKILGPNFSSKLSGKLFQIVGPFFRSEKIIESNIKKAFPNTNEENLENIKTMMWNNYGRIFAEYMFIKDFRIGVLSTKVELAGQDVLDKIKSTNQQVVFISGHFSNFELMAMFLEKSGIKLCTIYRPLNNIFLNTIIEKIRTNYICKYQIKKGIAGLKKLISFKKKNFSTALMIDQRVSEGILSDLFNEKALTTTIPAQLVKKFNIPVVPVYIERIEELRFKITIKKPLYFAEDKTVKDITDKLNLVLQSMISNKPEQWIWSHNRWK